MEYLKIGVRQESLEYYNIRNDLLRDILVAHFQIAHKSRFSSCARDRILFLNLTLHSKQILGSF